MSQTFFFGAGIISRVQTILEKEKPSHIFLVHGKKSYESSGAAAVLDPLLKKYHVTRFSDFDVNPKIEDVRKGIALFKQHACDFVIAVGGGTSIDIAKAVAVLACHHDAPEIYLAGKNEITHRAVTFLAIPTTSGSGSEATPFAVVYMNKIKYSLSHPCVLPDYAIVDPELTMSLSPHQTACTGMDALSQAIESFWSINSTEESKQYAREAIPLALAHLSDAVTAPTLAAREAMAKASHLAGKAIAITKTTAPHAISYYFTTYHGVPHGHAVALTLPSLLVFNSGVTDADVNDERGSAQAKKTMRELVTLLGASSVESAAEKITVLMKHIGLAVQLRDLGVAETEHPRIVASVDLERVKNNPRLLTAGALNTILQKIQ